MSVKELRLNNIVVTFENAAAPRFRIKLISGMNSIYNEISREQAHLLMLYLQEHLNAIDN